MSRLRVAPSAFRGDIEGLRGAAVLLVVLAHVTGWPRGGFVGVDVFFVISGYLITGLLVSEWERTGRIGIRHFYQRRARRLLPAGLLVLAVTDLLAWLLLLPSRAHEAAVDSLWSLCFLANVHFAALGTDYFSLTRPPSPVQHYWSLSVEEQFYLLWPALILATCGIAGRRRVSARRLLLGLASAAVGLSLGWSILSTARSPAAAYFSSSARAWELGAGAVLWLTAGRLPARAAWLGALGLVMSVVVITPTTQVPGYALLLPVLSTLAVLGAGGNGIGLGAQPVRYVGKISYSLYLWHWPCMVLAQTVPGGRTPAGKVDLLLLTAVLSVASYHLVEQAYRRPRPARATAPAGWSRLVAPSFGLVLVLVLAGTWLGTDPRGARPVAQAAVASLTAQELPVEIRAGLARTSWPSGLDAELTDAGAPEWLHDKCLDVSSSNADRCTYGPPQAHRTVALLGDSVAVSWLPALRRADTLRGARIHVLTQRQCADLLGVVRPSCAAHQAWALAQVRRLRPDLVLLSARYQGPQTPAQWRVGTDRMLTALVPYTHRIVVIAPPPDSANLQACLSRLSSPQDCTTSPSARWVSYANAEQEGIAGRATFVDPRPWLCAGNRCPAMIGDAPVMWDGRHLTAIYAARLAALMAHALT